MQVTCEAVRWGYGDSSPWLKLNTRSFVGRRFIRATAQLLYGNKTDMDN